MLMQILTNSTKQFDPESGEDEKEKKEEQTKVTDFW